MWTPSILKKRLHSQLCGTVLRKEYAVADREPCLINPKDAESRGIADGDVVRIFNDRGQVLAGAVVTDDIRQGVLRLSEGGWFDPVDPTKPGSLDAYGDANCLTVDIGTSKLAQANCGHTAVADVEKFTGDLPPGDCLLDTEKRLIVKLSRFEERATAPFFPNDKRGVIAMAWTDPFGRQIDYCEALGDGQMQSALLLLHCQSAIAPSSRQVHYLTFDEIERVVAKPSPILASRASV